MWMHLVFFCLRPTYEFETQAHALSSLCCPSFHSDGTCMKGGCFPNVPSNRCSFLCSFHPLSPQPLILLLIFLGNTFACLHRFIPQLWFRRQGCSHSLPALDQVTLPLLSRSPREGAPCQAYWSLPACLLACCLPLWACGLAQFNHRRPWSVESLQLWHRFDGKLCRRESGWGAGLAVVLELYFKFLVGWKKSNHYSCFHVSVKKKKKKNGFRPFCCCVYLTYLTCLTGSPALCITSGRVLICGLHCFMVT